MPVNQNYLERIVPLIERGEEILKSRSGGPSSGPGWISDLPYYVNGQAAQQWAMNCVTLLENAFGRDSNYYTQFHRLLLNISDYSDFSSAVAIMQAARDDLPSPQSPTIDSPTVTSSKDVFIAHGHDEAKTRELKEFLSSLGLTPIVLEDQSSGGRTIIEKFEAFASRCSFAFVLLTPDDSPNSADGTSEVRWRARQNVILELGWFMAKLGRERVLMLYKGDVELPTDLLGIAYQSFDKRIGERSEEIRKELREVGLIL